MIFMIVIFLVPIVQSSTSVSMILRNLDAKIVFNG